MRKLSRFVVTVAVIGGALVGLARATAIRWWRVPSDDPYLEASIAPSLRGGDLIILWRLTAPHVGDLVLCPEPKQPDRIVIGRITAIDGETIDIDGNTLRINGHRAATQGDCLEDPFTAIDPQTQIPLEQRCSQEEVGPRVHMRGDTRGQAPPKVSETTPPGTVFLVSDNRQMPYDSRDFGPVERATCKETVVFRLVSAAGFTDVAHRLSIVR